MGSGFKDIFLKWQSPLLAMVVMVACTPDPLDVNNVPVLEPKIVVASQMGPGQAVAVLLTKSIGALDASDDSDPAALLGQILISDATVTIDGNDTSYPLQYIGNGVYGALTIPLVSGRSYTLHVVSPSMGSVQATTVVKPLVRFSDIEASLYHIGLDTLAQVNYSIADQAGKNWYMINAQHLSQQNLQDRLLNPRLTTKLMDDVAFDGTIKKDEFKVLSRDLSPGDTLAVFLSNINADYYDFMKTRENTRFGIVEFLGEPIQYSTNVEGGLGFFNLYIPDVRFFILE